MAKPTKCGDEKQRLTMVGDYAFSASIDKGNKLEQGSALKQVGRFLNKQLKTVVVPESDKRVFKKWAHSAGHIRSRLRWLRTQW